MPKVSVLMPVYRTDERWLKAAIESVLAQTFRDFELLIVDDCPEDNRESVVRSFADNRIVYFKNERNLGITPSRNALIARAKGEYLAVFDHDDVCHADRFEKEVAYLDAHPECGVVSSWTRPLPTGDVNRYPENDDDIRIAMMHGCCVWHPAAMIRKSVLDASKIRYEAEYSPAEDYMLWLKLLKHTKFHNLPEPLTDYRWHDRNVSVVRKAELHAMDCRCKAWAMVHLPELWQEYILRRRSVTRVKLFGLPLIKIEREARLTTVRLFNSLPICSSYRKYDV